MRPVAVCASLLAVLLSSRAVAAEQVALRTADGRFLRAAADGTLRPGRLVPGPQETFELVSRDKDRTTVKHSSGRVLTAADKVEVYRVSELPGTLQAALAAGARGLLVQELAGKEYDKVTSELKEKYIELPAPTWRDPRAKKRHRILTMREEIRITAALDGPPELRITAMPYLKGCDQAGRGILMFAGEASLPVRGRVKYEVPGTLAAATGFRATVFIAVVGEMQADKNGDEASLAAPQLREVRVELRSLDLGNDLLHLARADPRGDQPRGREEPAADPRAGQRGAPQGRRTPPGPQPAAAVCGSTLGSTLRGRSVRPRVARSAAAARRQAARRPATRRPALRRRAPGVSPGMA